MFIKISNNKNYPHSHNNNIFNLFNKDLIKGKIDDFLVKGKNAINEFINKRPKVMANPNFFYKLYINFLMFSK